MSYEMSTQTASRVGAKPFNHSQSQEAEREYDRLRDLARQEAGLRSSCLAKSQQAYNNGDGGAAHTLSQQGKDHGAKMEQYNKQASEFIFRENNAPGRVAADTIDLHGQFVEEAEDILEERIRYAQSHGQTHLHVIVGRGNHSTGHVQKIKPRVEQVCRELGLQFHTEANEGRIYVNLTGGDVDMQHVNNWGGYSPAQGAQQPHAGGGYQSSQYPPQQQHQQQQYHQPQGHGQSDEVEKVVRKFLPRILKKLLRMFCN